MNNFKFYSISHITVLILVVLISAIFIFIVRYFKKPWVKRCCSIILATFLILTLIRTFFYNISFSHFSIKYDLPLHLCDILSIIIALALLFKNKYLFEISYYWALGATTQALLTPALLFDFPDFGFILFFANHSLVIIAIMYMTFGLKKRLYLKSIIRVIIFSNIYLIVVGIFNLIFKANYGFLCRKPINPTLLDYLGPWPYYLISLEIIGIIMILLLYLPFYIYDKRLDKIRI